MYTNCLFRVGASQGMKMMTSAEYTQKLRCWASYCVKLILVDETLCEN